mgnify:CR=1 FL=1
MKKVAVIDYGLGNITSIMNSLNYLQASSFLTKDYDEIMMADALILPGVGAFKVGMANLEKFGLVQVIKDFVQTGKPFLGICLGMQMLFDESYEFGVTKGLGLIQGQVKELPVNDNSKLPHISWNEISESDLCLWKNTILDTGYKKDVYFVHSFVGIPLNERAILATSRYGDTLFCAAVKFNNVYGTQFHPEKSGKYGLDILNRFINS